MSTCTRIDAVSGDDGRVGALVSYIHSPGHENVLERVIENGNGNLFEITPEGIALEMRETADAAHGRDRRVSADPFEHFVISYREEEAVTKKDMEQSVAVALKHLGMEDHQYVWAAHDDTGNVHIHLVVSRINPTTLQAVTIPFPVKQAEQIGALINHTLGFERVENNRYIVNDKGAVERIPQTAVKQPDLLRTIIDTSRSWGEFHQRTREAGINYERKGSGALINNEKASDVDRNASLAKLVKKFGEYQPHSQPQEKHHASKLTDHNIENLVRREEPTKYGMRKLSERHLAAVKGWHSTSLLQTDVQHNRSELRELRRSEPARRAIERAADRKSLSDEHRAERSELFKHFKERKQEIWKDKTVHGSLRAGLSSVVAAEQAMATAELRDKQKAERESLRADLNRNKPLMDKSLEVPNGIHGINLQSEVEHKDIRAFKPFIDTSNRRVIYSTSENGRADFIDTGKEVSIISRDDNSVLAALQLANAKFGKELTLTGSDDFKQQAIRIAVENNIIIANPELQEQIAAERERVALERKSIMQTQYPNRDEFQRLAAAVPADRWRVTLGSFIEIEGKDGKPWTPTSVLRDDLAPPLTNTGAGKGHDGLSVEQISKRWGYLEQCQSDVTKARVILTPASDTLHIIHIDDVSKEALEKLKKDGYTPSVIIATSTDKKNVIMTCPKDISLSDKQQHEVAKQLSQHLNKTYGDPEARNAMQPFRAPGFANMKPKYKQPDGSYPKIVLEHAQRVDCDKVKSLAAELSRSVQKAPEIAPVRVERVGRVGRGIDMSAAGEETKAYLCHVSAIRKDADAGKLPMRKRSDGSIDQSSADVLAAQRMRMTGWTQEQIAQGAANGCNAVRAENGDAEKRGVSEYATWIASTAAKVDLSKFDHQVKYRVKDEKAAGIVSPVVQRQEQQKQQKAVEQQQERQTIRYPGIER